MNPEVNTVFDFNRELIIEIEISDDVLVAEYKFWLESDSGWEYFSEKKKVNKNDHTILYTFDLSSNSKSDISIHLEVVDNDGNMTYKNMKISTL